MTQLNITLEESVLKALMLGDRDEAMRKLLEEVFNAVLKAEASEQLGAEKYERTDDRVSYRNGYRSRALTTRVGSLTLHIPKFRDGTFSTTLFKRYARSEQALMLSLMQMVIQGVSTRKVSAITETLCGTSFSKSTVSALCMQLDPIVKDFKERPLGPDYPFVIADAIYTKARGLKGLGGVRSKGVLIAIGVKSDGHREVLGFEAGDGESADSWKSFFRSLKARGLREVDLVVSDAHKGLIAAIGEQFEGAMWQRCQTHFSRDVLKKLKDPLRAQAKSLLYDLYNSPDIVKACERKEELMDLLEKKCPQAADTLDKGFDDVVSVFYLPKYYRTRLRTSNSIERLNEELRRRERVIRIFPNEESIERLFGSLLMEHHERWVSGKVYLDMKEYYLQREEIKDKVKESKEKWIKKKTQAS